MTLESVLQKANTTTFSWPLSARRKCSYKQDNVWEVQKCILQYSKYLSIKDKLGLYSSLITFVFVNMIVTQFKAM